LSSATFARSVAHAIRCVHAALALRGGNTLLSGWS
jgi:hypothetical protein